MDLFGHLDTYDYGEVHLKLDKATGLRAIVAIHDTRLGPSLGGCRFIQPERMASLSAACATGRGSRRAACTPPFRCTRRWSSM